MHELTETQAQQLNEAGRSSYEARREITRLRGALNLIERELDEGLRSFPVARGVAPAVERLNNHLSRIDELSTAANIKVSMRMGEAVAYHDTFWVAGEAGARLRKQVREAR